MTWSDYKKQRHAEKYPHEITIGAKPIHFKLTYGMRQGHTESNTTNRQKQIRHKDLTGSPEAVSPHEKNPGSFNYRALILDIRKHESVL